MLNNFFLRYKKNIEDSHAWGVKLGWLLGQAEIINFCKAEPETWGKLGALSMFDKVRKLRDLLPVEKQSAFDMFVKRVDNLMVRRHGIGARKETYN